MPHAPAPAHDGDAHGPAGEAVRGLGIAEAGMRLEVDASALRAGRPATLRLRLVDAHGEPVRDLDVAHERRLHLIVVRRDLTAFQHLHPRQDPDGTWTTPLTLPAPGTYRVLADVVRDGDAATLATDLHVDGNADLRGLPAPATRVRGDDGYDVAVAGDAAGPGEEATLRFSVTRAGRPVALEPYLGAGGHLVALREGDLAFLHVHPRDGALDGGEIAFDATFPTTGRYRLFLQFRTAGSVRTVAVTREVGA